MLRVSIFSDLGQKLGDRYDAHITPFFVILNSKGDSVSRGVYLPARDDVLAADQKG
ncbi:MAG TPA: hypothetical protein VKQ72_07280 [Aggregatilineales bacterium]|nr:hypothetical protein [Aggregatilineales bacterium]